MKNANLSKSLVLCLFGLLALTGCKEDPEPKSHKYIGLWDFTTHLSIAQYDFSVSDSSCTMLVEDSIINFRGSISTVDGNNRLLIEFIRNELLECRLDEEDFFLWKVYSNHDHFYTDSNTPLGKFVDYDNVNMQFHKMGIEGDIHTLYSYKITGTKKK